MASCIFAVTRPFDRRIAFVMRLLFCLLVCPAMSHAQDRSELQRLLAPTGTLRASINLGNPILANRDPQTGQPVGVSIDLAAGVAERLGVPLSLVVFDKAAESVDAVAKGTADIGFFAIDPQRGAEIAFTPPYVLIEGAYLVKADSPITANEQVDRAGHRVAVGKGSAYDLYLSRNLQHAQIERAPSSPEVVPFFLSHHLEVAAGVKQQLEADARREPGLRLLPGRFMIIRQAMGLAKARGEVAAAWLSDYVQAQKASGFVAQALKRHGVEGAGVAGPRD
jgi:ABC-type amino acid transport substrate-binding protein